MDKELGAFAAGDIWHTLTPFLIQIDDKRIEMAVSVFAENILRAFSIKAAGRLKKRGPGRRSLRFIHSLARRRQPDPMSSVRWLLCCAAPFSPLRSMG